MSASIPRKPAALPALRATTITALLAVTLWAGQTAPVLAQAATPVTHPAASAAAQAKAETVEDRITDLHASLKITAAEEADWTAVALVMRNNAAAMEKLATDKAAKDPATLTAIDDLKTYEVFAQAHVAGLQKLITAFDTLYTAMPADQKKIADGVFQRTSRRQAATKN